MQRKDNIFTSYDMTQEEIVAGSVFTPEQIAMLRNDLSEFVTIKLQLKIDGADITSYMQNEAALAGKIAYIQYILARHDSVYNTSY